MRRLAASAALAWASGPSAPAQGVEDWLGLDPDAVRAGAAWVRDNIPEEVLKQVPMPDPADWQGLWRGLMAALQSAELADLAWIRPEAERALRLLQASPATEPYAAWLLQRLDYIDMAQEVLAAHLHTADPLPRPPPPAGRPAVTPPPRRPAPEITPSDNRQMKQEARRRANWDRKMAGRPKPARAEALAPGLKKIFEEEGVAPEWIWLAEVESSFNPSARSPVGARGLFQFMPATAERFGLKIQPEDERLSPEKSARAAARYLRFLHGRFQSWPLALAAYNAGEGRVGRLLKERAGARFEDIVDHLPSETQMYVPKVLATVSLREWVEAEHLPPPRIKG